MSNDYRNSEGYPDPTAGEALSRIAANEKQSLRAFRPIRFFQLKPTVSMALIYTVWYLMSCTHSRIGNSLM